jgi:hypothetical protein
MGVFDIEHMIEKAMEHVDIESIAADVMPTLSIPLTNLYIVARQMPDCEDFEVVSMAYGEKAAKRAAKEHSPKDGNYPFQAYKVDLGRLLTLAQETGSLEEI